MYFQSGIGAQDQRLKLPDGRLVQVEGPDASKSLVTWMPRQLRATFDFTRIHLVQLTQECSHSDTSHLRLQNSVT